MEEERIYDAVIVGGGISGLCAAYGLRDKDVCLLESDDRFGGRVLSEKFNDVLYNVGTQFIEDDKNDFNKLLEELGVEKKKQDVEPAYSMFWDNKLYEDAYDFPLSWREKIDSLRFISKAYRWNKLFLLPQDDPRWQNLVKKTLIDLQQGFSSRVMVMFDIYLQGAIASTPEHTSGGIGARLVFDMVDNERIAFIKGGTQQITDALAARVADKLTSQAKVAKVEEIDGIVHTTFRKEGQDHVIKSRKAIITTPAPLAIELVPNLPDWKRDALSRVEYGLVFVTNIFFKKNIPWKRWNGMLAQGVIFDGILDTTFNTEEDQNSDTVIYNFIISRAPQDQSAIDEIQSKSDEELVALIKQDFARIVSEADIDQYIIDAKVSRYPLGENAISTEFYSELLPDLAKPVGNIHFCGEHTDKFCFLEGAAASGFRVARELGSELVPSENEEVRFGRRPLWGIYGWGVILANIALIIGGSRMSGVPGAALGITGLLMLCMVIGYPFYTFPMKAVYKGMLYIALALGGIAALYAGLIR